MSRMKQVQVEQASGLVRNLFGKVEKSLGLIPNMFRCMANSVMGFDGFLKLNASLMSGKLGGRLQKLVILATSEFNGCEYCAAAHTKMAQDGNLLSSQECLDARRFVASDPKEASLLKFVSQVLETRGQVSDEDLSALREKGFGDEEIVEILGTMALATYTNYISSVGHPDLDFPEVPVL